MDKKEPKCIPAHSLCGGPTRRVHPVYQIWHLMGVQQHSDQTRGWVESCLPNTWRIIQTSCNVFWTYKLTCDLPNDDEHNLQMSSYAGMVFDIHGWWHNLHKTITAWNPQATLPMTPKIHSWNIWHSRRKRPIRQTQKMHLRTRRNWLFGCHSGQGTTTNGPKETIGCRQLPSPAEHHGC